MYKRQITLRTVKSTNADASALPTSSAVTPNAWDAGDTKGFRIWAQHHAIEMDKIGGDILDDVMQVRREAGVL